MRNILSVRLGVSNLEALVSSILDIALGSLSVSILLICLPISFAQHLQFKISSTVIQIGSAALVCGALAAVYSFRNRYPLIRQILSLEFLKLGLKVFSLQIVINLIGASVFVALMFQVAPSSLDFSQAVFAGEAFIVAAFVGFLMPGSPGGLGVREACLILLLPSTVPKEVILPAALLHRLLLVAADACAFGLGVAWSRFAVQKRAVVFNDHRP